MPGMQYVCLYSEYLETLKLLSDEELGRLVRGMLYYNNSECEPDLQGNERLLWATVKSKMDRDTTAYLEKCKTNRDNGSKGGRPKKNRTVITETERFSEKPKKPNKNRNKNNSRTETIYSDIVRYLNQVCGTSYRENSQATKRLIDARTNEGFSLDDFKTVIDNKHLEWGNDFKMRQFLRPETLFGTKFESYLNQTPKQQPKPTADDDLSGIL